MAGGGVCGYFTTQYLDSCVQCSPPWWQGQGEDCSQESFLTCEVCSNSSTQQTQVCPQPNPDKDSVSYQTTRQKWPCPRSDSSPESVQSHDTVSTVVPQPHTVVPQPQTSVIAWKADSSLDLDEDETSVLLDESVVRSEDGGATDRSSEGEIRRLTYQNLTLRWIQEMNPQGRWGCPLMVLPTQVLEVFHPARERLALGGLWGTGGSLDGWGLGSGMWDSPVLYLPCGDVPLGYWTTY